MSESKGLFYTFSAIVIFILLSVLCWRPILEGRIPFLNNLYLVVQWLHEPSDYEQYLIHQQIDIDKIPYAFEVALNHKYQGSYDGGLILSQARQPWKQGQFIWDKASNIPKVRCVFMENDRIILSKEGGNVHGPYADLGYPQTRKILFRYRSPQNAPLHQALKVRVEITEINKEYWTENGGDLLFYIQKTPAEYYYYSDIKADW